MNAAVLSPSAAAPGAFPGLTLPRPGAVSFRVPVLPWASAAADEQRFRRIWTRLLAVAVLFAVALPFVPLKPPERIEARPLPPPIARLLIEENKPAAPPPPALAAPREERPTPATEAEAPKPRESGPKPVMEPKKAAPVPEARRPVEGRPPGEVALENARKRASGVGLLAMKNELAEMTGAPMAAQLKADIKPGPGVGTGSGPGVGAGTEAGVPVRAMITAGAGQGSGGINTAAYSRNTGGGGLAGRSTTLVEGVAGGGGGGGPGGGGSRAGTGGRGDGLGSSGAGTGAKGGTVARANSGKASRSIEDVRLVFERNKGAIYAIYNRALRDEPGLQGKVVLSMTIAPGGEVTALRIVSSELKAAELESKLLARIRQFDFGAKDVEVMVVNWPLDFLPS